MAIPSPAPNHRRNLIFIDHQKKDRQILGFQKLRKQVSLFRSCTLCVQGSAQKQDVSKSCGNNTYCCSEKGVALARGGGGITPISTIAPNSSSPARQEFCTLSTREKVLGVGRHASPRSLVLKVCFIRIPVSCRDPDPYPYFPLALHFRQAYRSHPCHACGRPREPLDPHSAHPLPHSHA